MTAVAERIWNHADARRAARRRLPRFLFEYIDRGAEDETALAGNRAAFDAVKLLPRVCVDMSRRDASIRMFDQTCRAPMALAPVGSAAMTWRRGEAHLAQAAADAGLPMVLTGVSSLPIEEAVSIAGNVWFQLYVWEDERFVDAIVDRVAASGARALVVTLDSAVPPIREYNARNGFNSPFKLNLANVLDALAHPRWLAEVAAAYALTGGMPRFENMPVDLQASLARGDARMKVAARFDWEAFARLRRRWTGPLLAKGVMSPVDARLAVDHGADGVIVSNHGGRNLDSAPAPLDLVERVRDAVGDRAKVLMDGGVRRGGDVVKALALGADAVLVGRPVIYGLAAAGPAGAARMLKILAHEIDVTMGLIGCPTLREITHEAIHR